MASPTPRPWIMETCEVCGREIRLRCQGADVNGAPWYSAACKYCGAKAGPTYIQLEWERQEDSEIQQRQHEALEHAGETLYTTDDDAHLDPLERLVDPRSESDEAPE